MLLNLVHVEIPEILEIPQILGIPTISDIEHWCLVRVEFSESRKSPRSQASLLLLKSSSDGNPSNPSNHGIASIPDVLGISFRWKSPQSLKLLKSQQSSQTFGLEPKQIANSLEIPKVPFGGQTDQDSATEPRHGRGGTARQDEGGKHEE
jgi:hypothetical protein